MDERLVKIKKMIQDDDLDAALSYLNDMINREPDNDEVHYLLGNLYRKRGDWQLALNHYLEAIERNPESPAVHARQMLMDILEFYNKDMYNQ